MRSGGLILALDPGTAMVALFFLLLALRYGLSLFGVIDRFAAQAEAE